MTVDEDAKKEGVLKEEEDLLERTLKGDQRAFAKLYARWTLPVQIAVARTLTKDARFSTRTDLLDAMQYVWLKLTENHYRQLRIYNPQHPRANLRGFLHHVATLRTKDWLRKQRATHPPHTVTLEEVQDGLESPRDLARDAEARHLFGSILKGLSTNLSPKNFQRFHQLFIEGRTTPEISGRTGETHDSINSTRREIRREAKRLRAKDLSYFDPSSSEPGP